MLPFAGIYKSKRVNLITITEDEIQGKAKNYFSIKMLDAIS